MEEGEKREKGIVDKRRGKGREGEEEQEALTLRFLTLLLLPHAVLPSV